jgi:hypothetical protein
MSCYGPMAAVVNVMVKRRDIRSRQVRMRETSANELMTHRNCFLDGIKTGEHPCSGKSMAATSLGKGTRGRTPRPNIPMRPPGADCFVVAEKRSNACGAKGAGHSRRDR